MPHVSVNGVRIFYELRGNPNSKEVVAFFNGVIASVGSWAQYVPVFEHMGFKILLHDFKGQLLSDKPAGPYTFKEHAAEARVLMEQLGIECVHLVGTSYGGEVALRFAIDYPEMVKTLCVIDSASELDRLMMSFIESWRTLALDGEPEKFYWGVVPTLYSSEYLAREFDTVKKRAELFKNVLQDYFYGQVQLYETFLTDLKLTPELHKIKCPTLVICGEKDILKPPKFSKIISDQIVGSEFVIVPDAGHVLIYEKPEVLKTLLVGFIFKHVV
ncbi:alpha/beta fold hydrolase [Fervidobacterium thailandense]|uniref:Alpha/beta hydrolase n=1 Tax=Fervidobacterium thailandense TaxID=1008305 RepID=A0A1E3G0H7_9BACT|nr:alpha/beta hydrolase [Fervidobacterium thailandense]ODN29725.1 alpha/beta hydrolase [Fervidobacterium thailandense]